VGAEIASKTQEAYGQVTDQNFRNRDRLTKELLSTVKKEQEQIQSEEHTG
jgi:hypothetical protein